ncbi:hypothetical protein [Nocardia sp. NPDC058705]|uniref:hypothetical protein n=1 Tax=Nocardia sp. NPDC058705 TaxID=3346609 RepID=UPI0036CACDDC
MMEKRPARAPGIARALAVLTLLAGIIAMHSAVFGTAHATDGAHGPQASAVGVDPVTHLDRAHPIDTAHHPDAMAVEAAPTHTTEHFPTLIAETPPDSTLTLPIAAPADPHTGCGAAGCDEHTAVHGCVFILAALAIALTLVLLYRLGDAAEAARRTPRIWRGSRARPPPWTVLTLSQLAILRI